MHSESPGVHRKQISERTKKNLRNIYRWRLNTQVSKDELEGTKKIKFRTGSLIELPKETKPSGNIEFHKNYDSLALRNGREDLVRLYFNYNPNFKQN